MFGRPVPHFLEELMSFKAGDLVNYTWEIFKSIPDKDGNYNPGNNDYDIAETSVLIDDTEKVGGIIVECFQSGILSTEILVELEKPGDYLIDYIQDCEDFANVLFGKELHVCSFSNLRKIL